MYNLSTARRRILFPFAAALAQHCICGLNFYLREIKDSRYYILMQPIVPANRIVTKCNSIITQLSLKKMFVHFCV